MNNRQNAFAHLVNRAVSDSKFSHMRKFDRKGTVDLQHPILPRSTWSIAEYCFLKVGHCFVWDMVASDLAKIWNSLLERILLRQISVQSNLEWKKFFFERYGLAVETDESKIESGNVEDQEFPVYRWRVNQPYIQSEKNCPNSVSILKLQMYLHIRRKLSRCVLTTISCQMDTTMF